MSEESEFFRNKEWPLQVRFEKSFKFGGLVALPVTAIGVISTIWNLAKKESIVAGLSITAVGATALLGNLLFRQKLDQEFLDLDACKLGILPREDLDTRHVHLSQKQWVDLRASIDKGEAIAHQLHPNHLGHNANPQALEAVHEHALEAARTEWRRRVQLNTEVTKTASK